MATEQSTYRATNDAYTGMLVISLIAMIGGSSLLYLDYQQYPDQAPKPVAKTALPLEKAQAPPEKAVEQPKEEEKKGEQPNEQK